MILTRRRDVENPVRISANESIRDAKCEKDIGRASGESESNGNFSSIPGPSGQSGKEVEMDQGGGN
jgi:hypothetical protein